MPAGTRSVTVFELSAPQPALLRRFVAREIHAVAARASCGRRLRLVLDDGRSSLEHGTARYDMIEADALRPDSAGSGNLYSRRVLRTCARRLKPGGLVCSWAPTLRVYASFCRAFPNALEIDAGGGAIILIGSDAPIALNRGDWRARAESEPVQRWLGPAIAANLVNLLRGAHRADPDDRATRPEPNTDLFPRDEFLAP